MRRSKHLSESQRRILVALRQGCHLKVHRTVDGAKVCRLHFPPVEGSEGTALVEELRLEEVDALERGGFVRSNMKFPAATLLLTELGLGEAETLLADSGAEALQPLGPRRY